MTDLYGHNSTQTPTLQKYHFIYILQYNKVSILCYLVQKSVDFVFNIFLSIKHFLCDKF